MKIFYVLFVSQFITSVNTLTKHKIFDFGKHDIHYLTKKKFNEKHFIVSAEKFSSEYSNQQREIILNRKKRDSSEDNISPVAKIFVDSLVNTIKPSVGDQGFILEALKPFLVSVGAGFVKEFMKFIKNILDQGPFIDAKAFTDQKYEAYPVFIPSYGSFMLISKSGSLESMKKNLNDNKLEKSDCKENCTESIESINKTESVSEKSETKSLGEENIQNPENFFIGEAHLVPIKNKTDSFESPRQLEEVYKSEDTGPVKEYMKQVMESRMDIKSFKKRLLLSMLKKMETAIKNL